MNFEDASDAVNDGEGITKWKIPSNFTGLWIPKSLFFNKKLSWAEKLILTEISLLDKGNKGKGCYAGNEHLGWFFNMKTQSMKNLISKLTAKGYIKKLKFDGRKRWMKVTSKAGLEPICKTDKENKR